MMREAARGPGGLGAGGSTAAIRRIQRELKEIMEAPSRHWTASPHNDDLFEWMFALRGPPSTDFEGGIYTGRLVLPVNYPFAPPSVTMLTPSGRWEVGKKICLSNSSYHPELWQPAWGIRTMMEAMRGQFPVPGDGAIGSLDWPSDIRKKLALESLDFVDPRNEGRKNRELLPELTPEELKEDQPEPVPPEFLAPAADKAAAQQPAAEGAAPAASPAASPASAPAEAPAVQATPAPAEAQDVAAAAVPAAEPQVSAQPAPAAAPQTVPVAAAPVATTAASPPAGQQAQAAAGAAAPAARRRRAPDAANRAAGPRRGQSVVLQLLKPPQTKRGRLLMLINFMIFMLTVTFIMTLVDLIRHPPSLLDPVPDPTAK
eukprot:TRINITY_DN74249_c0_g1_i1.p1 TRINITY_DN74249_c0_g1~~TRINITY_DN74249_c0_g1_i1.p1  ORF type:complete len:373 (-),score=100.34 TRINITY_DN74249_c0_g1_i1:112-1230(-)